MSRTRVAAYVVTLVGGILVLNGLFLGFSNVDNYTYEFGGESRGLACGSVFGSEPTWVGPLSHYSHQLCSRARSDRQTAVWALLAAGLVALGAGCGLLLIDHRRQREQKRRNR